MQNEKQLTKSVHENIQPKGMYRFIECDPSLAPYLYSKILQLQKEGKKIERKLLDLYHKRASIRVFEFENLCPTVGRSVVAQRLAGVTTYTGTVNYAALGSNATVPTNGDTTLGTETYRKTIDEATYTNNVAYLSVFIASGVATSTHYEAGLFIDGGAGADSGQLVSHVLLSPPVVKSALSSLTLDVTLTIS